MRIHRLASALASVGLGCGILFSAAFARDVYSGISGGQRSEPFLASHPARPARLSEGELIARLVVPRLAVESPVFEGVAAATLARGAGHLPQTPVPGDETEDGASVIAIARGGCAAAVSRLRLNDHVRMTTSRGLKRYRVVERQILEPRMFRLAPPSEARVTLITPYPPDSPGPAPMRLAVSLEQTAE
jgi:sortase A